MPEPRTDDTGRPVNPWRMFDVTSPADKTFKVAIVVGKELLEVWSDRSGEWEPDPRFEVADLLHPEQNLGEWDIYREGEGPDAEEEPEDEPDDPDAKNSRDAITTRISLGVPAGQPGGGQWGEGGGGGATAHAAGKTTRERISERADEKLRRRADANIKAQLVAKDLGFPPAKIKAEVGDHKFTLGGKEYVAAGTANRESGEITIWSDHVNPDDDLEFKGLVAHEVEHQRFNTVFQAQREESKAVMALPSDADHMRPDGTLRPPYDEQFPIYSGMLKYYGMKSTELHEQDGVSEYSREYWEDWKAGKTDTFKAIHETLAEIARFDAEGIADHLIAVKERPDWVALYDWINDTYDNLRGQDVMQPLLPKIEKARGISYARMKQLEKAQAIYKKTGEWPVGKIGEL